MMLSLWACVRQADVEAYVATLMLPPYLAHLRLDGFAFDRQTPCSTGRESLVLTYVGQGRLEEYPLAPEEHVLPLLKRICPNLVEQRIQLARDDAAWFWPAEPNAGMRIYFAPTSAALGVCPGPQPPPEAYVSVSRRHIFLGRTVLEAYVRAWFDQLGLDATGLAIDGPGTEGGIGLCAGRMGGQWLPDDPTTTLDLVRFAGLEPMLAEVASLVQLDPDQQDGARLTPEGLFLNLGVAS